MKSNFTIKKVKEGLTQLIFEYQSKIFLLVIFINDGDYVEIFDEKQTSLNLIFDATGNIILNNKYIGRFRQGIGNSDTISAVFNTELLNQGKELVIQTNAVHTDYNGYFIAEEFVTKYLINQGLIKI